MEIDERLMKQLAGILSEQNQQADERLIKQLADVFSTQNQLAIEQDVERRCDEIQNLFDEMIGLSDDGSRDENHKKAAYKQGCKKMPKIRERMCRLKGKIEAEQLTPEFKKSVAQDMKRFQETYDLWKEKYMNVLFRYADELLIEVFDCADELEKRRDKEFLEGMIFFLNYKG